MARTCYLCAQFLGETRKKQFFLGDSDIAAVGHTVGRDCFFAPLPIKEFLTPMTKKN